METNTFTYNNPKVRKTFYFILILYIDPKKMKQFSKYYQEIQSKWSSNLSLPPKISSSASQIICYNKHILVDKRSFYNTTLIT